MIETRSRIKRDQHRTSGMQCPSCGQLMPISIEQILYNKSLRCPVCGLILNIDKSKSDKALKILSKVDEAQKKSEESL